MKYATLILFFAIALTLGTTARSYAQPRTSTPVQETDDEFKVTTYKRFVDNREPYPAVAYKAAKDYMAKYNREDDQYTRYLRTWIAAYAAKRPSVGGRHRANVRCGIRWRTRRG